MCDVLTAFLDTTSPLGKGVTQVTYPSENQSLVIKLALVHTRLTSVGFDGVRDAVVPAHCAMLDRMLNDILLRADYLHLPKTIHQTLLDKSAFPVHHIHTIPNDFLCNVWRDVCVQATVQERIHGLTLHEAIDSHGASWTIDDWKSLVIYIVCSLIHLYRSCGYIQWDSHPGNLMITLLESNVRLAYALDDTRCIRTPASKLLIKWMDTSSAMMTKLMDPVEAYRACAQRYWFNVYLRQHYKKHVFVVPAGILDWLNMMLGIEQAIRRFYWTDMTDYVLRVTSDVIRLAFSVAYKDEMYDVYMSYEQVLDMVKRDQMQRGCWRLPPMFATIDGALLTRTALIMFADHVEPRPDDTKTSLPTGPSSSIETVWVDMPHVKERADESIGSKLVHCIVSMHTFLDESLARHGLSSFVPRLVEMYAYGKLFVPVLNRTAFDVGRLDVAAVKTLKHFLNECSL